jgi:23S rRNA (pseudouridine1915-N3)-methyltransferase
LKLTLLWVGRTKDRRLAELIDDYLDRIGRYCKVEIVEVKEASGDRNRTPAERVESEGARVLEAMKPGAFHVALDEAGREMTSVEFASFLGKALEGSPKGVTLILGGPYGLSEKVRSEARALCALSRMTLTHEMARLVAADQVYRAFTILRGERYHH